MLKFGLCAPMFNIHLWSSMSSYDWPDLSKSAYGGGEGSRTPVREAFNDGIYTFSKRSGSFGVTRPVSSVAHPRDLLNLDQEPGHPVSDPAL